MNRCGLKANSTPKEVFNVKKRAEKPFNPKIIPLEYIMFEKRNLNINIGRYRGFYLVF